MAINEKERMQGVSERAALNKDRRIKEEEHFRSVWMDSSGDMSRAYKKKYICLKLLMNVSITKR